MKKTTCKLILTSLLIFISTPNTFAKNHSKEFDPTPEILHHIANSHEWHLWGDVSIPLPIILYTEGEIDVFSSSKFHHNDNGSYVVKINNKKYVKYHEKIYQLNEGEEKLKFANEDVNHERPPINTSSPTDLSITKNVTSMILSVLILFFLLRKTAISYKNKKESPKGIQAFLEPLILFVRNDIIKSNIGPKHKKYTMFLMTIFFFILINNLLGLTPGAANVTGNISVTFVLSFFTFIIIIVSANKGYWKHIVKPPGTPTALLPIMIPIEIFGVFTKPFALMIRLFANITAGHIIIFSLISLIFVASNNGENVVAGWLVAPISTLFVLFIFLIEILVAFLQAYIFTLLSAVFIGLAVKEEDH